MKLHLHFAKVGLSPLKILALRINQICQQAVISTSMKKGLSKLLLAELMPFPTKIDTNLNSTKWYLKNPEK
jgi:hypothetical protein